MEFKAIIYVVMGMAYLLYSLYQKGLKQQEKKTVQRPVPKSVSPPTKSVFEQALEEIKQQAAAREAKTAKQTKPLVQQKINPLFEEGKTAFNLYEREMTAEETRATEAEEKRVMIVSKAFDIPEETETKIDFDARQALISSVIFERKF